MTAERTTEIDGDTELAAIQNEMRHARNTLDEISNRVEALRCAAMHNNKPAAMAWPLREVGEQQFFGYLIGLGIAEVVLGTDFDVSYPYADFIYHGDPVRYRLPWDESLLTALGGALVSNLVERSRSDTFSGKFWIIKTADGYEVEMP